MSIPHLSLFEIRHCEELGVRTRKVLSHRVYARLSVSSRLQAETATELETIFLFQDETLTPVVYGCLEN